MKKGIKIAPTLITVLHGKPFIIKLLVGTGCCCHFSTVVSHWVPTMSYHFRASHIHRSSVAQATAGDISAPLNNIVWVERDAYESLQLCIWNHTPIPWRTRASLHSIKQSKVVQRPSAIFRCEGSKSITEGRYWDSWISTSSGTGVIMHLYLSTSSSLCPHHHQIHFPVSQYCILPYAWPVEILEILIFMEK